MDAEHQIQVLPFYLAVSAQASRDGDCTYRIHTIQRQGDRLMTQQAGLARPACQHLTCRLANLGAAAVDWAYLLQLDDGPDQFHAEQMGLTVGPE